MPKKKSANLKATKRNAGIAAARQVAALPFRLQHGAGPEFLLVTTRATRRWTIPKGWTMRNKSDAEAAAQEAFEEAGISGCTADTAIGRYSYFKRFSSHFELVEVDVYPVEVEHLADDWPEREDRERDWFALEEACENVTEPELKTILTAFSLSLAKRLGGSWPAPD